MGCGGEGEGGGCTCVEEGANPLLSPKEQRVAWVPLVHVLELSVEPSGCDSPFKPNCECPHLSNPRGCACPHLEVSAQGINVLPDPCPSSLKRRQHHACMHACTQSEW